MFQLLFNCCPQAISRSRILAERFYVIGTLRSNFLLHKKTELPSYTIQFCLFYFCTGPACN